MRRDDDPPETTPEPTAVEEREELLEQVSDLLERPMIVLSLVWLVMVVLDLTGHQHPLFDTLSWGIWGIFLFHFLLEFAIAPRKGEYLKTNWLTALSLVAPALRLLRAARLVRVLRAARAARGLRLLRVVSTANRGLRTLRHVLARRGVAYVFLINAVVLLIGAGGMYAFERPPEGELSSYGESLWWTAMLLTTLGSDYWPRTLEGRLLAWLLALFAFSVFGYVTATLASLFVRQDAQSEEESELRAEMAALRAEVSALHAAILQAEAERPEIS